jgi:hypothetical protein
MPDRLLIVRPPALGAALARAVERACARRIAIAGRDVPLLDARLACGDFDSVRVLLGAALPDPALPLFVARYAIWTGDLQSVAGAWPAVRASLDLAADPMSASLRRTASVEIAQTATDLGDAPLAARLLGSARSARPAERIPGSDPPADADPDSMMICDVAFNILGLEPDAARGRLRLRPRLDRFAEIEARNIRFADGSVGLSATRDGAAIVLRIEQHSGAIPMTVLLEPFVDGPVSAEVDGSRANLTPRKCSGGTIVPVQLVLDQARTLIIHTGPPANT